MSANVFNDPVGWKKRGRHVPHAVGFVPSSWQMCFRVLMSLGLRATTPPKDAGGGRKTVVVVDRDTGEARGERSCFWNGKKWEVTK